MSALEAAFLDIENANNHMHIALTGVFGPGPLVRESGQLDMRAVRGYALSFLDRLPEWRQRVMRVPVFRRPVWVDDPEFDLDHHLHRVRVPPPGGMSELKELAGRLYSTPLLRGRPLWEDWFVEGLRGGGFAVVIKAHHCMVDGVAGIATLAAMLSTSPEIHLDESRPWRPRPAPQPPELFFSELLRRRAEPAKLSKRLREAASDPARVTRAARAGVAGVRSMLKLALTPSSRTPINPKRVGPDRRCDWTVLDLNAVKAVKCAAGCKVNDVVLATVAGALRSFLEYRGAAVDALDFRVMVPVSTHLSGERGFHNRVSMMLAHLPVSEPDPRARLQRVKREMTTAKSAGQSYAVQLGEALGEWTSSSVLVGFVRGAIRMRPYNIIVTDIFGPQQPLYLMGSRLTDIFPMVPLYGNQAVGIALVSYDGRLFWGFNADRELVPDIHELARHVDEAFRELAVVYAVPQSRTIPSPPHP